MIRAAARMTFLFNEDIIILQVGLIVFLHYKNEKISNFVTKRNIYIQCNLNNWLYQYIDFDKRAGGNLHKHLRCQKKRRKRYGSNERRGKIPNRVSIEQRPALVDERKRLGDWEADTMIGKKSPYALVTLVERKARFTLLKKIDRRTRHILIQSNGNRTSPQGNGFSKIPRRDCGCCHRGTGRLCDLCWGCL